MFEKRPTRNGEVDQYDIPSLEKFAAEHPEGIERKPRKRRDSKNKKQTFSEWQKGEKKAPEQPQEPPQVETKPTTPEPISPASVPQEPPQTPAPSLDPATARRAAIARKYDMNTSAGIASALAEIEVAEGRAIFRPITTRS